MATGVKITGNFVTNNPQDTYALLEDKYLLGGYRVVDDIQARNDIPSDRRKWGMLVGVVVDNKVYQLVDQGNNDLANNTNWIEFSAGGGVATPITDVFNITASDVANGYVTLTHTIDTTQHDFVFLNGLLLEPTIEYTISGNQVNFTAEATIEVGDKVIVKYYI